MSEAERRTGYDDARVLIQSSRILLPQFPAQTVQLSGAQVELLRNITSYLNRRTTFVAEYQDSYYLTPIDVDWDDIQAMVASLEEKLMVTENVIWGYKDRLFTREDHTTFAAGAFVQDHSDVPANEIWVVSGISLFSDKPNGTVTVLAELPTIATAITNQITVIQNQWIAVTGLNLTMKEGDHIAFSWKGLVITQRIISNVWGYVMSVLE
jgi:hypothetical protein